MSGSTKRQCDRVPRVGRHPEAAIALADVSEVDEADEVAGTAPALLDVVPEATQP